MKNKKIEIKNDDKKDPLCYSTYLLNEIFLRELFINGKLSAYILVSNVWIYHQTYLLLSNSFSHRPNLEASLTYQTYIIDIFSVPRTFYYQKTRLLSTYPPPITHRVHPRWTKIVPATLKSRIHMVYFLLKNT